MAYNQKKGQWQLKWDKEHYLFASAKVPLDIAEKMKKCTRYQNTNQFINLLIREEINRDGLMDTSNGIDSGDDAIDDVTDGNSDG